MPDAVNSNSTGVSLERITKRFDTLVAVDNVSLDIKAGEFFSLLGPSGCGKTTLLRMIAGFEKPDSGVIRIDQRDITRTTPQQRPTAMVFQNYALFPTMTVTGNVAYGLKVRKVERAEISRRVDEALERVDMSGLGGKPVTQLSGGQQQRVALARALAVRPSVILFDEPLSNLDVTLREQTRRELKLLQRELGTTSIYVTHDQQEALALSDTIAVMRNGALQQIGSPEGLYREPDSAFVARFLGGSNIVSDAAIAEKLAGEQDPSAGVVLAVRPEHLHFTNDSVGVPVSVKSRQFLGTVNEWWLESDAVSLRAWVAPGVDYVDGMRLAAAQFRWVVADMA
jgi:ABC-type Fe3+/spermidine/putrescine transport system ATPase subunit